MEEVSGDAKARLLSNAIVAWTGWGRVGVPARDEMLVIQEVGADKAMDLMPLVLQLYNDFYTSKARWFIGDLTEMGDAAASEFRERHPELSEEAVQALRWCYQFDYK